MTQKTEAGKLSSSLATSTKLRQHNQPERCEEQYVRDGFIIIFLISENTCRFLCLSSSSKYILSHGN